MQIDGTTLEAVYETLRAEYPDEGCGFLLGRARNASPPIVTDHLPVSNQRVHDDAATNRYLIAPHDFLSAEREARVRGAEIVGVYHSHPDAPARPSEYDREHAWPWYQYLIVSVAGRNVQEARVWTLADDRAAFDEGDLKVMES